MSDETTAPEAPVDLDSLPEGETFPRSYVEKLRSEAAARRTEAAQYKALGDVETLKKARDLWQASGTEEGLKAIIADAADVLKIPSTKVQALYEKAQVALEAAEDKKGGELTEAAIKRIIEETVTKPAQEARVKEVFEANRRAVNATLKELGVDDDDDRALVLKLGDKFLPADKTQETAEIIEAVKKGHAAWVAKIEAASQKYLESKKTSSPPKGMAGGSATPTGETLPEPKNVAEVRERRMARRLKG